MSDSNRRQFLKFSGLAIGSLFAAKLFLAPSKSFAQSKKAPKMLDPKDATAKAVKYVEDHKKSAAAKGNHCTTCAFYTKKEMRDGKEVGACIIFPEKYVYGAGFCSSWAKKS